jgi:DNA-binding MarR family transcriptional regulator
MSNQSLYHDIVSTAKISQILAIRFFNSNKKVDITYNQFEILSALKERTFYQRDLAKFLLKGTSNLSKDLNVLEKKQFIKRIIDTKNNRMVKNIVLTEKGNNLLYKIGEIAQDFTKKIEDIYTNEEYLQFKMFLNRLKAKLTESVDMVFE